LDGWYNYNDSVILYSNGVWGRSGGTGIRLVSWSMDGGPDVDVETTGTAATSVITMTVPHSVSFNSVRQYQVNFEPGSSSAIQSITPPTIGGDKYWYDDGTPVTLVLKGVYGRSPSEGLRVTKYSINGKEIVARLEDNVSVLSNYPITSPINFSASTILQYKVAVVANPAGSGTVAIEPSSTVPGDTGWYDIGSNITLEATPLPGYTFLGWTGSVVYVPSQQSSTANATVYLPITETANFEAVVTTTTASSSIGRGSSLGQSLLVFSPLLAALVLLVVISGYALYIFGRKRGQDPVVPSTR
jgi:hypothetical protein